MKRLEIISVRTAGGSEQEVCTYMKTFCREVAASLLAGANLYVDASAPGDLAVVLMWQAVPAIEGKTTVGLRLADALKRFGLVEHVFWILKEEGRPERPGPKGV